MTEIDPTDIAALDRAKQDIEARRRMAAETEQADFRWLMGTRRGRRIVWRLLDRAGVFRLSFNTNAMQMAFAEGNRNEGLRLIEQIHTLCPELYPVMVREQTNGNRSDPADASPNDQ